MIHEAVLGGGFSYVSNRTAASWWLIRKPERSDQKGNTSEIPPRKGGIFFGPDRPGND